MGRHIHIAGRLRLLLTVLGGSYLGLEGWAYLMQDSFVYAPSSVVTGTPHDEGLPYDPITLNTPDGEHLTGWFIPAATTTPTTVLFLHGSGGNIAGCLAHAAIFHQLGVNMLLFDYRGYGQSTGTPSEAGLATDAELVVSVEDQTALRVSTPCSLRYTRLGWPWFPTARSRSPSMSSHATLVVSSLSVADQASGKRSRSARACGGSSGAGTSGRSVKNRAMRVSSRFSLRARCVILNPRFPIRL